MFLITYRKLFVSIGVAIILVSAFLVSTLGLRIGIDFTGGSLTEVSYSELVSKETVEGTVTELDLGATSIRESTNESGREAYFVRTRDLTEVERAELTEKLVSLGEDGTIDRFTTVGPVIGQELKDKAGWAVAGIIFIIVLYVAFAFAGIGTPVSSWIYGLVTIFVLVHDVIVPTAVMSLLGYFAGVEVDVLFVMALLAVLGYSVNDTIVIFDRVRENLMKNRTEHKTERTEPGGVVIKEVTYTLHAPYETIVGSAVKETLARSINTSLTTFVALVALYFIGGTVTQTFALVLMAGVLAGAYSSICIASPLIVLYADWKAKRK